MNPIRALLCALGAAALLAAVGCDLLDSDPPNDPPTITAISADPAVVRPESLVIAAVTAEDPEGADLDYAWTATAGSFPDGATNAAVDWRAPSVTGLCTLTVTVDDGRDATSASAVVEVSLGVPVLVVSADTLDFGDTQSSLTLTVSNPGSSGLAWLAAPRDSWVGVDPASGTVPADGSTTLTVTVDRSGGAAGVHHGRLVFTSNAGFDTVHVRAEVPADPHLWARSERQHFGLATRRLPVEIRNIGNGGEVVWTAAATRDWMSLSPASGATGAEAETLWVEVDRTTLPIGTNFVTLTITDAEDDVRTILFRVGKVAEPARSYTEIARFPHDPDAFTQGLEWSDGVFIEGTGLHGQSTLRRVDPTTGVVQQSVPLGASVFGEGLTVWNDTIIQLTWQAREAYVWDAATFAPLDTLTYPTQGWGLTHDAERLIMSDGSANLYFRDPTTFAELGRVAVTSGGVSLNNLNELEWIDGLVWANVWLTDYIVRIDPDTGDVFDWLDLTGLLPAEHDAAANVLNGIAWDAAGGRLFVTGKDWPLLFEIEPTPAD